MKHKILFTAIFITIFIFDTSTAQVRQHEVRKEVRKTASENRGQMREARREIRKFRSTSREIEGQIQVSGAFALYPLMVRWADEFGKLYPRVRIDISAGGAGKGITDALTGMVDMGMVSREINPAEIAKGAYVFAVAKDAVVPTINSRNPLIRTILYKGLTQKAAIDLWKTGANRKWGQVLNMESDIPVHVYTRSDACGAAETWAAWLGVHQEDLEGTAVYGDPGVASVLQRDKVSIGFNNMAYAYDIKTRMPYRGIMVIPLDLNNNGRIDHNENFYATADDLIKAISDDRYPTPPARMLYLVTNGKPTKPELLLFLEYILTQGQIYANESLYIPLSAERQDVELKKLD